MPSLVFFALARFSARPECENSFSRSYISFGPIFRSARTGTLATQARTAFTNAIIINVDSRKYTIQKMTFISSHSALGYYNKRTVHYAH